MFINSNWKNISYLEQQLGNYISIEFHPNNKKKEAIITSVRKMNKLKLGHK